MPKIHLGLVSEDAQEGKALEGEIKKVFDELGGGYVHTAKTIFELMQKMSVQKMQVIVLHLKSAVEARDFKAAYHFIRGKRELGKIPICLLSENSKVFSPILIDDNLVRAFPIVVGAFVSINSILGIVEHPEAQERVISDDWITNEFLESLRTKVGQKIEFKVRSASEDERRTSFYSEISDEVRTHLGWFKFTARMIESSQDRLSNMFKAMSRESIEEFSTLLLGQVVKEFNLKVENDFAARGAIYLPEIEQLQAAERKSVYDRATYRGIVFEAQECTILLEICRYL